MNKDDFTFVQILRFASNAIREAFGVREDGPGPAAYDIRPSMAGLPDYHKKQIDYFKEHIKNLRQTNDLGASWKS